MVQIYHNSRCSKSRECLAFLEQTVPSFEVINYLKTPPTFEELELIIKKLGINPLELVRTKEKIWIENFKNQDLSDEEIIHALSAHPTLIERPIVIKGDKAIIARPLENINTLL
jgi:arsenate reductase